MDRRHLLVTLAVLTLALPVAQASVVRTETEAYVAGTDLLVDCETNVGGACFRLLGGETNATITIEDASGLAVSGSYRFEHPTFPMVFAGGSFCGTTGIVPVPNVTPMQLVVFVDGPLTATLAPVCAEPSTGTTGNVTVAYSP